VRRSALSPTPHLSPSGVPPVVRLLWYAVSASAAALPLYPGETVAQPKKKENDCGDEDDEH
jgi:hypothetical protein